MNYKWNLKDTKFKKNKGKVFSCFSCGGGSTMGYKLAGFDVIGCNEIDKKMLDMYKENHNPKFSYLEGIQTFKNRKDLPKELFNLDILDGSPPCSSFSTAGNRDKDWGKEKKFKEGQTEQVLDTLFFDFIDLAKRLQPKVVIAENVPGLLIGKAKPYVIKIYEEFDKAGYYCQHFVVNASKLGVPQRRKRVFFICLRKDLSSQFLYYKDMFTEVPKIDLEFNEKPILFSEIKTKDNDRPINKDTKTFMYWSKRIKTDKLLADTVQRVSNEYKYFTNSYLHTDTVCATITSNNDCMFLYDEPRRPNKEELLSICSFPQDYNFLKNKYSYVVGMSVPPLMTAKIAEQIYKQWLNKIK